MIPYAWSPDGMISLAAFQLMAGATFVWSIMIRSSGRLGGLPSCVERVHPFDVEGLDVGDVSGGED